MDGYCPVTLLEDNRWQRGNSRWGAIHRGRTYLFASQEYQRRFIESPDRYSPVLAGIDPVMLVDQGKVITGKRAHGVVFDDHVYLFSSEEALRKFWSAPETYAQPIRQAMRTGSIQQMLR
jgi:protein disulfide-isomerase